MTPTVSAALTAATPAARPAPPQPSHGLFRRRTERPTPLTSSTAEYVLIPNRLLELHRHAPTAIGVYALIARLFLVYKQPVPLSRHDLQRFDPALTDGIKHVLDQLVAGGWLLKARVAGCRQTCYTPAWGLVGGVARPWVVGPRLGKPRHVGAMALPRQLLDTLMGRVSVAMSRPALIDRYFDGPALHLADVGAYALTQYGYPTTSARLVWLGLVVGGQAVTPPADRELLQRACQPTLDVPTCPQLGPRGEQYLGWWQPVPVAPLPASLGATQGAAPAAPTPGFFSPADMGEDLGLDMITPADADKAVIMPLQRHDDGVEHEGESIPGNPKRTQAIIKPSPSIPPHEHQGGGKEATKKINAARKIPSDPLPPTATTRLLRTLDVRPDVIRELAGQPEDLVQAAISDGRSRPAVRDLAGWVVSMVRDARDYGWGAALRMRGAAPRTADVEMQDRIARMKATGLFRSDDDLGDTPPPAIAPPEAPRAPAPPPASVSAAEHPGPVPAAQLIAQARQALRARVRPQLWPIVAALDVRAYPDRWELRCGQRQDQVVVRGQLLPLLGGVLRALVPAAPPRILLLG
jgi:hypothetical protein